MEEERVSANDADVPRFAFHQGDPVVLAQGAYQGTTGTFLRLTPDPKWAEILQSDKTVWDHPVEWLALRPRP